MAMTRPTFPETSPPLTEEECERYPLFVSRLDTLALPAVKTLLVRHHKSEQMAIQRSGVTGKGAPERIRCFVQPTSLLSVTATLASEARPEVGKLHVSIAHPRRLPTWEELKAVKEATFGPLLDAMQVLPREVLYYSLHPFCLHLWEMPVPWIFDRA